MRVEDEFLQQAEQLADISQQMKEIIAKVKYPQLREPEDDPETLETRRKNLELLFEAQQEQLKKVAKTCFGKGRVTD